MDSPSKWQTTCFFVENTWSLKASPKKRNLSMFFQVPPPRWISCPTFPKHRQLHPMQAWLSPNRVWHHLPKSLSPSQLPRSPWSSVFLTIHVMRKKTPSITQLLHNSCMQMTFCRLRVANLNMLLCKTCNQCVRQNLPVQLSQWNIVIKIVIQVNYSLICAMVKIRYNMVIITIYWSFHSHSWFPSAKF